MKRRFVPGVLLVVCTWLGIACSKENEEALKGTTGSTPTCDTANMRFSTNVLPILRANCYGCHGNGAFSGGINLDTYANVKLVADGGSLVGAISHASGYSPMPKNGAKLSDCDIDKIKAWVNRGAPNN